ncbi:hypothetical protein PISMIDRAFT_675637 [Pisolithus microcarpus 441]|uniref:Uncharacterized protein n=1 Tax=Pisolithus microcarpus 441 TaxID=765257 RepID=A0A0C9ZL87_9AGAM|nr:hypothetical protein BKA83DRAFT_675637 [Pisolithus microcarpus]KIK16617.1 hypothetical protein PISMIDRAFT_686169 [Pisolithus microcarpus 441]KIK25569.1 hypothetical protein PISMIDRAFT_677215 [Pisolithus microcarpus 441]KIK26714.1 hypothetical protein PISMIDRAFT_675637 [Pisolithus microcarpus 441]
MSGMFQVRPMYLNFLAPYHFAVACSVPSPSFVAWMGTSTETVLQVSAVSQVISTTICYVPCRQHLGRHVS